MFVDVVCAFFVCFQIYQISSAKGRASAHGHVDIDLRIMTNEPSYQWQLQAVKHLQWKESLARSAVSMPGSWYPDSCLKLP